MAGEVRVQGLRELQRAFARMDAGLKTELRGELVKVAEPVRSDAQRLAFERIRNIGPRWSRMRVGVTTSTVYVAPTQRRRGGSPRANLAPLLMDRSMQPALDQNQEEIVEGLDLLLGRLGGENGF